MVPEPIHPHGHVGACLCSPTDSRSSPSTSRCGPERPASTLAARSAPHPGLPRNRREQPAPLWVFPNTRVSRQSALTPARAPRCYARFRRHGRGVRLRRHAGSRPEPAAAGLLRRRCRGGRGWARATKPPPGTARATPGCCRWPFQSGRGMDTLRGDVGRHPGGRMLKAVAVVQPDPGVVGAEGDVVGLAGCDVERVGPPRAAGGRLAVAREHRRRLAVQVHGVVVGTAVDDGDPDEVAVADGEDRRVRVQTTVDSRRHPQ